MTTPLEEGVRLLAVSFHQVAISEGHQWTRLARVLEALLKLDTMPEDMTDFMCRAMFTVQENIANDRDVCVMRANIELLSLVLGLFD